MKDSLKILNFKTLAARCVLEHKTGLKHSGGSSFALMARTFTDLKGIGRKSDAALKKIGDYAKAQGIELSPSTQAHINSL